jgi:glycosyltransferase involved in cell wall biosynthesis
MENKKPKILVCAFACLQDPDRRFGSGQGGEGVLGWNVVLQLARFFDVHVLTHVSNQEAIEKTKPDGLTFYYIDTPSWFSFTKKRIQVYAYVWQIAAYFFAKKLHSQKTFDAFHHITYANDWMASFIGALLPIPYLRGPGGGAHFVPEHFVQQFPFKERLAQMVRRIGQWIFRHDPFFIIGQRRAKALLVCNHEAFDILSEALKKKAHLFPVNGVSSSDIEFLNSQQPAPHGKFLILSAGKLIRIKGFDIVIRAFKMLSDRAVDAKLVIVGEGPELDHLKRMVKQFDLEEKVIFSGWLPRPALLKQMVDCDVFLFGSLRDGGGNVVVEAMAAGKPVVCVDAAGPGYHIEKEWGMKIKAHSPEQLVSDMAEALNTLYQNPELRKSLGDAARERAQDFYSWDALGGSLYDIYKEVLSL